MSEIEKSEEKSISKEREFDQEHRVGVFRKTIFKNYKEISEEIVAYRTVKLYPISTVDQLPLLARREKEGGQKVERHYSTEEIEQMSEIKIIKEIGHYAISINDSPENCEASAIKNFQRLRDNGATEEELQAYIEQRGEYIAKIRLTKECGLVTEFNKNGHANLLPYKDVILEEYRDKNFYHKINYSGASGKQ